MRAAGLSSAGLRFASMAVLLLTTPLLLQGLGKDAFGVFVTITALTAYLAMSDLGIGAGLLTLLGGAAGQGDRRDMAHLVITAGWILSLAGAVVALVGISLSLVIDIPRLLGAPASEGQATLIAYRIFIVGLAIGIPLSLAGRVQASLQQGSEAAAWASLAITLSAVASAVAAWVSGSLPIAMFASVACLCLVWFGQAVRVGQQHPWMFQHGFGFAFARSRLLMSTSAWLFILQMTAVIAFQTDILIVSAMLGSDQAAVFHGALRVFALVSLGTTALASQFWPATAEAMAMRDHNWVRHRHRALSWQLPALAGGAGLFLVAFGPQIIELWLGTDMIPPRSLLLAMALWTTYVSFVLPYTQVLNAAGFLVPQVWFSVPMVVLNLLLSVWLTNLTGLSGPPLGSLVAHLLVALVPTILLARKVLAP